MRERIIGMDWIRAFACLSVVWIHSISRTVKIYELPASSIKIAQLVQLTFIFATPMFVMISIYILSYSYKEVAPKGFWKKRILYILMPYFTISILYALYMNIINEFSLEYFLAITTQYILQIGWSGYFILIIFQFYILHFLLNRFHHKVNPYFITALAIVINILYNYYVNYLPPPHESLKILWYQYGRVLFPGWVAFFIVAYYAGRYVKQWNKFLIKAGPGIIVLALFALLYSFYNLLEGNLMVISSRRNDILLYTILLFLSLLYMTSSLKTVPWLVKLISKYSFPIFLLHIMFIDIFARFQPFELSALAFGVLVFFFVIISCILFSWIIKWIPGSALLIGLIDRGKPAKILK